MIRFNQIFILVCDLQTGLEWLRIPIAE